MSADSAVTYTSVHSEARSWSILSEDPYEEAARQLLEQAPRSLEYVPDPIELEDHVPVYIPEQCQLRMRHLHLHYHHSFYLYRLLLTAPRPGCEVGESSIAVATARQPGPTMARRVDCSSVDTVETRVRDTERRMMAALEVVNLRVSYQKDRAAVRAEIEVLRRERLAYEQESMETRQALARSEAYSRALEARVTVLETQARRHEWQRQDADDCATRHIMCIQALEAGAREDTY
ncbi:hypothetical protein Tco_0037535, partial [Tanacetum coccineum]